MTTQTSPFVRSRATFSPRSEQKRGIDLILKRKGARLFLHPGKGKTVTVLTSFGMMKQQKLVQKLLVLAPLRVISTWVKEIEHWEHTSNLTYSVIHGDRKEAMEKDVDIYLMNYEGLLRPEWQDKVGRTTVFATKFLQSADFMLAVDESTKMKNSSSSRFKVLKRYLHLFKDKVIMTGTPKPSKLEDLFAQCYITDSGADLGTYVTHFRRAYMRPADNGFGWTPNDGAHEIVAKKIAPTTLQIEYEEAVPTSIIPIWVDMPEKVKPIYNELKAELIAMIQGETVIAPNTAVVLGKLKQIAQGALYKPDTKEEWFELHGGKLDALENILEELDGEPAFCLTQYKHDVARISARLKYAVPYIGSGTTRATGNAYVQSFSAGATPLLLGHPLSVAHGIDGLQNNCGNVIWFGLDWSWENYYQANSRIVRSGSKSSEVFIYHILVDCPTERAVLASVTGKMTSEADFLKELRKHLQ